MILGIVQARISSTRLPGKVTKSIMGEPMLALQLERIRRSVLINELVVATSNETDDDEIAELCTQRSIDCYRGSLDDVLDRFYQAAKIHAPDYIVRLTGDCPLVDPGVIDDVIAFCLKGGYDYASNTLDPTFPDGLDIEICRFDKLQQAANEAVLPSEREHVTSFIESRPDQFMLGSYRQDEDLSHLRWTVDEPEDFEVIQRIYQALYPTNADFRMAEILNLYQQHPELEQLNARFTRNEAYKKSLREDAAFIQRNKL
ncbi:MAG: glycosyltransferase family protein [Pseudomonadales bacterium]